MPQITGEFNNNAQIDFRSYMPATMVPDPFNAGLVKVRIIACSLRLEILTFDSSKIWQAVGNPNRYRFGRATILNFDSVVDEVFLNYTNQWIITVGLYTPTEFFEAEGGTAQFSAPVNLVYRADSVSVELADTVQARFTLNLLPSAELSGVSGIL